MENNEIHEVQIEIMEKQNEEDIEQIQSNEIYDRIIPHIFTHVNNFSPIFQKKFYASFSVLFSRIGGGWLLYDLVFTALFGKVQSIVCNFF